MINVRDAASTGGSSCMKINGDSTGICRVIQQVDPAFSVNLSQNTQIISGENCRVFKVEFIITSATADALNRQAIKGECITAGG